MKYRVLVTDPEGRVMRQMIVLADNPSDAVQWGHDWLDLWQLQTSIRKTGWRIESSLIEENKDG